MLAKICERLNCGSVNPTALTFQAPSGRGPAIPDTVSPSPDYFPAFTMLLIASKKIERQISSGASPQTKPWGAWKDPAQTNPKPLSG